jgi:dihydroorotase
LLPLSLALVEDGALDLMTTIRALTVAPAKIMGLDSGTLAPGAVADLVIFDAEAVWTPDETTWRSQGRNTPYWGQKLKGRVRYTLLGGEIAFEREDH